MLRTVLLRHELPDGSWHFDWMLELPPSEGSGAEAGPDARRLMTFRAAARPDEVGAMPLRAERLADHRAVYLTYQGELSGGRGRVSRVAEGGYRPLTSDGDTLEIEVRFSTWERPMHIRGRREGGEIWIFSLQIPGGACKMA